jgi:hypothetical protein
MCIELALLKITFSNVSGDASILALMVVEAKLLPTRHATKLRVLEGHLPTSTTKTFLESAWSSFFFFASSAESVGRFFDNAKVHQRNRW